ncbi:MAG: efflux RND transporter permease subunit [Myxococcales bacterium]|nr:efflux RND transporter permease subunit [Myxococcales bacterium]
MSMEPEGRAGLSGLGLSDLAIRRPVFIAMLSVAIVVLGLLGYSRLATDLYPPVNFPFLIVQTVYPGASPTDMERDVTEPLEDAVGGISGIKKLQSFSRDSVSLLMIQFDLDINLDEATNSVRDRVGAAEKALPDAADPPLIRQIDIGALPVLVVAFSSSGGVNDTRQLAEDRLKPLLEQVEGVGTVNVIGGQRREVHVDLDLDKLTALGVAPSQVAQRIGYENISVPIGQFKSSDYTIAVRATGQFKSVGDLGEAVIHNTADGRLVRLKEVASVTDGFARADRYVRNNLQDAVTLEVVKKSSANAVTVSHLVQARLSESVPKLGSNAVFEVIADQADEIEANAHEVWVAIYYGGAMAIAVILFFLLDWRGTLISALALPTSIIGTFAMMQWMGFSLNTMTLMGMSLAIGLLIDDAVVVREAITRRLEMGEDAVTAASKGTAEIALAVLATTMSLVAVFVPVAFMSGMVGQFFKQFGLTIAVAVTLSLFVAFTLDPMLSSRFSVAHRGERTGVPRLIERFLEAMDAGYRRVLSRALQYRFTTAGITVLILALTVAVGVSLPVEFVPKQDRGEIQADVRLPVGTSLAVTNVMAREREAALLQIPGVRRVYSIVGHEDQPHRTRFRVSLVPKPERSMSLTAYEDAVRTVLEAVPNGLASLQEPSIIEGLGDWPPFMLIIQGPDIEGVVATGKRVETMLKAIPGTRDVRLTQEDGRPELVVDVDRAVAADRGIPAGIVGLTARSLVEGNLVGSLRDGGPEAQIRVRAAPRFAVDVAAIKALPLPSPRGRVTVGDVAQVRMGAGASAIMHHQRMRAVTVWSQVAPGAALGDVLTATEAALAKDPLPDGYTWEIDGQARDMQETGQAMGLAIGVAFVFIFMVLASQFESLVHPFTLMLSVPLAMVGAFLGLAVAGHSISMGSQIGIILLMGLVTKNAILLVDGALVHLREGMTPVEAMLAAGPRRLRPIVMTSAAMALGMLPTALGTGTGSEFRSPMAVAVIGGVLSSTLLTLLVVPVGFVWMEQLRSRVRGR